MANSNDFCGKHCWFQISTTLLDEYSSQKMYVALSCGFPNSTGSSWLWYKCQGSFAKDPRRIIGSLQTHDPAKIALAVPLNVEHELTRQRKWDKQETQEYMWHFNALKLDKLTSDPR